VTELVFYCKEGHEPVAAVGNGVCASCGGEMKEIGWLEGNSVTSNVHPAWLSVSSLTDTTTTTCALSMRTFKVRN
jgi:hypothetical protein